MDNRRVADRRRSDKTTKYAICVLCIFAGTGLAVYIFAASRSDPSQHTAALVIASNVAMALIGAATWIVTGRDLTKHVDQPGAPVYDDSAAAPGPKA